MLLHFIFTKLIRNTLFKDLTFTVYIKLRFKWFVINKKGAKEQ